jgi:hypothetical protein
MAKRPKLFLGTPMYGGMCTGFYTLSLLETQTVMRNRGVPFVYSFVMNEALITRARNWIVYEFLKTDFSHLLFVDADIRWIAEDIPTLIDADKDIICGLYPSKEINWHQVENAVKNGITGNDLRSYTANLMINVKWEPGGARQLAVDQPFEITAGGTGMMLIKREVFEALRPHLPTYLNNVTNLSTPGSGDELISEFFSTSIDQKTKNLLSEDYFFCDRWRNLGGTIWAAPWMRLGHQGSYVFEGRP